jgi:hypothetical protein
MYAAMLWPAETENVAATPAPAPPTAVFSVLPVA